MSDYDSEQHFIEQIHHVMSKCQYRRDMYGVGICSLNVLPCEKVLYKGDCEAVAEWYHSKGGDTE